MDWNAGVPACNVAFFSDVKLRRLQIARAFSCFALMQAGTPAFQSVDESAASGGSSSNKFPNKQKRRPPFQTAFPINLL